MTSDLLTVSSVLAAQLKRQYSGRNEGEEHTPLSQTRTERRLRCKEKAD